MLASHSMMRCDVRCVRNTLRIQVLFKTIIGASTAGAVQRAIQARRELSNKLENRFQLSVSQATQIQLYSPGVCKVFIRCLMDAGDHQEDIVRAACGDVVNSSALDADHVAAHNRQLVTGDATPQQSGTSDDCEKVLPKYPSSHQEGDGEGADPYSRRGYTSEVFKIEIENLPQWSGYKVCHM